MKVVDAVQAALKELELQLPQSVRMTPVNDRSISVREALHDVTLPTLLGTIALVVFGDDLLVSASLWGHGDPHLVVAGVLGRCGGLVVSTELQPGQHFALGADAGRWLGGGRRHRDVGKHHAPCGEEVKVPSALHFWAREKWASPSSHFHTSLIAVFIPIFFMPGVIGLLFHEFAVVVGLAIEVSAFVSLTLVPLLASRFLTTEPEHVQHNWLIRALERGFDATGRLYARTLDLALGHRNTGVAGGAVDGGCHRVVGQCDSHRLLPARNVRRDYGQYRGWK
ncbi:MAG: efflux RND transporter permease subunit [Rhodoferax sp.]|nr:efflux RND transporter permease subunit [Rhodoferax sp.]MDZ7921333.1 efflux RND transporter permease subunit [Rhodoferax sp.]